MTLADLRRLAIRQQLHIRYRLQAGLECVITEHGIAQVPGLKRVPDFNLEQELALANEFLLEPVAAKGDKRPLSLRRLTREEMARMTASAPAGAAHPDHDDE